jgi:ribosomal protein L39E
MVYHEKNIRAGNVPTWVFELPGRLRGESLSARRHWQRRSL